jgi:DNA-binding protein YbaB
MNPSSGVESGPDPFLRNLSMRSSQLRERAEQMQAELAKITETVKSRDGNASVTVGAGGIMRGLAIEPAGTRAKPEQLSRSIMIAYQQACRRAAEQGAEIMQRHAPGSPAVTMMREAIPPDPEEDEGAVT